MGLKLLNYIYHLNKELYKKYGYCVIIEVGKIISTPTST